MCLRLSPKSQIGVLGTGHTVCYTVEVRPSEFKTFGGIDQVMMIHGQLGLAHLRETGR